MQISRVQANYFTNYQNNNIRTNTKSQTSAANFNRAESNNPFAKVPVNYKYGANIHFGEYIDPNRTVPHVDYEEYLALKPAAKERLKRRYQNFLSKKQISKDYLIINTLQILFQMKKQ